MPTARLRAFSNQCTHLGCRIDRIAGDEAVCPCHGSRYRGDGTVVSGPARRAARAADADAGPGDRRMDDPCLLSRGYQPRFVTSRLGTLGEAATAAFVLAAASGVVLAVPYEPSDAMPSLARLLLANPAGVWFRNLHYWAAQLCFVLTLLHAWDHLRAVTEGRVGRGVWLRLALTLPLTASIMLSGFLLRGDADAQQALRILTEATAQIPLAGPALATLIFGAAGRLDIVYVQHAATATIAVWLFVIEHSRRVWPRPAAFLGVVRRHGALSLVVSPGLHDGLDPVVKGPWYFLGLQEILHWTPWPSLVVLGGILAIAAVFVIRIAPARAASRIKAALLVLVAVYAGLCGIGAWMRGRELGLGTDVAVRRGQPPGRVGLRAHT